MMVSLGSQTVEVRLASAPTTPDVELPGLLTQA